MDVTVQLPDEVLCHAFSFLPLRDKLRSERVNRKFQRCVLEELKANPRPLELSLRDNEFEHPQLNEYGVPPDQIFSALQTLVKKAKFNSIQVRIGAGHKAQQMEHLNRILFLLISEHQCLSKVTAFETDSGCSQVLMENFLDKCDKLNTIVFRFCAYRLSSGEPIQISNTFPMDLGPLLKNRHLTQLTLQSCKHDQACLIDMLDGIKPNALRKLHLCLVGGAPGQFLNSLSPSVSALEEIRLAFQHADVQLADLFESLAQLPALRECQIILDVVEVPNQMVAALTSLFKMSHINISVLCLVTFFEGAYGYQFMDMIRQIQVVHPGLVVDFRADRVMVLRVGNAIFEKQFHQEPIDNCGAEEACVHCAMFYPTLLKLLRSRARLAATDLIAAQHFPHWRLDRCRVGNVLDDLNGGSNADSTWKALLVETNEEEQSVIINFETQIIGDHLFSITVSCGHCLTNGCMQCGN